MKTKEFCFIICTNDICKYEECEAYIKRLLIPEGYSLDIITIWEAESICSAYNAGMQASEAKYKIYMHQDVFIINPYFLYELKERFERDSQVGMIGMIGSKTVPLSGVMWDADRYGSLYETHVHETVLLTNYEDCKDVEVALIDGFMMATQYDIRWREDLFDKWDYYDASQSMEFRLAGHKVLVPWQKEPWCIHDCGYVSLKNYENERCKFVKEYLLSD